MRFVQAGVMILGALLLGPAAYVILTFLATAIDTTEFEGYLSGLFWAFVGWNLLLGVVTVLVLIDSILKIRSGKTSQLATGAFLVKLAAIPFSLLSFVLWVLLYIAGIDLILFGGPVLHFAASIGAGVTYLATLSTSIYGFATIVQLRRERRIDTVLGVLYVILLLVFVSDTVAAILLFAHSRRRPMGTPGAPSADELHRLAQESG